jgi:Tfp pilus assembly protein PilN
MALNFIFILGFFLYSQQKNRYLTRYFDRLQFNIKSKENLQIAVQDFKSKQEQVFLLNQNVADLEQEKIQTVSFLVDLVNQIPAGISLIELTKLDKSFLISGKTSSKEVLRSFVHAKNLKLLKSKRRFFEASGST